MMPDLLGSNHFAVAGAMVMIFLIGSISAARLVLWLLIDPISDCVNYFAGTRSSLHLVGRTYGQR